ncbi:MAG: hypothetical protein AW07_01172 [Candidatus Accumulibacter sp. SK-11]|nr:MAG: hypothetical protein AW07_01172 [Candidatus Accumulibacter sp. SK-11]
MQAARAAVRSRRAACPLLDRRAEELAEVTGDDDAVVDGGALHFAFDDGKGADAIVAVEDQNCDDRKR